MDALPLDVQRHIQSFLFIVSWRAEQHYAKLFLFLKTRTFENLPDHMKQLLEENETEYVCHVSNLIILPKMFSSLTTIHHMIVRLYTAPLRSYLTTYRWYHVYHSWSAKANFQLLNCDINGIIDPSTYRSQLQTQARIEGCYSHDWQGCLPLSRYKGICIDRAIYLT